MLQRGISARATYNLPELSAYKTMFLLFSHFTPPHKLPTTALSTFDINLVELVPEALLFDNPLPSLPLSRHSSTLPKLSASKDPLPKSTHQPTMSFRSISLLRPLRLAAAARAPLGARSFHATRAAWVRAGDELPEIEVTEGSPGNKVVLAREAQKAGKALLIGVPAAFSGACSSVHVPGYIHHPRLGEFDFVGVVSVNDAFV